MPELTCPVCGGVLHREERSLRCDAGHCYDLARRGYVNLLRTNQSKDKRHGDDQRMVAARTAFLDAATTRRCAMRSPPPRWNIPPETQTCSTPAAARDIIPPTSCMHCRRRGEAPPFAAWISRVTRLSARTGVRRS